MSSIPKHRPLLAIDEMPPHDATALLDSARALQRAALAGQSRRLLWGRKVGLLCDDEDDPDAALLYRAASELGAHVACIRPNLSELGTPQEVQRTARLLGRLYDALVCHGMTPVMMQRLSDDAGVPVYGGIASSHETLAGLADKLGGDAPPDEKRRFLLQAALSRSIA